MCELTATMATTLQVLLTLWTLVGGVRSVTGVKTITIGVNIPWTTCESDVAAFSVAAAVFQGMLILLGVFLSVQSWHVEESVAEARPMAIAICTFGSCRCACGVVTVWLWLWCWVWCWVWVW